MAKLILEITEKEKQALKKANNEVKDILKRITGLFKLRLVEKHKKSKK